MAGALDGLAPAGRLRLAILAGEASGDQLGARLMQALSSIAPGVEFHGVGGPAMSRLGLQSWFSMDDLAVMGFGPVLRRLPLLLRRIEQSAQAIAAMAPDGLVLIDAQDFSRRVAARVRELRPTVPIVLYVSPTVWAWRPGRARRLKPLIDHLMAVLPFEPAAHARLGGPPCSDVGHPLVESLSVLQPSMAERQARQEVPGTILVLPGSRRSEINRLMAPFGQTVAALAARFPGCRFVLPAVSHVEPLIRQHLAGWPVQPDLALGENAKLAAFRGARAALAASGTVTLELALAQVPMVVAYRMSALEWALVRRLVTITTPVLPNLILGRTVIPAYLQGEATAELMTPAMAALIEEGAIRDSQLAAFGEVLQIMQKEGEVPSLRAARVVLDVVGSRKS